MISVLLDHNIPGFYELLIGTLTPEDRTAIKFLLFSDVGLPTDSADRKIWDFI